MTDDELLTTARGFVATWQPRLHLAEWRIVVALYADAGPDNEACVSFQWKEFRAYLRVRPGLPAWKRGRDTGPAYADESDDALIEAAVVHELVHLTQLPLGERLDAELKEWLGTDGAVASDTRAHWHDFVELVTERTTRLLLEADRGAWHRTDAGDGVITRDDALFKMVGVGSSKQADDAN